MASFVILHIHFTHTVSKRGTRRGKPESHDKFLFSAVQNKCLLPVPANALIVSFFKRGASAILAGWYTWFCAYFNTNMSCASTLFTGFEKFGGRYACCVETWACGTYASRVSCRPLPSKCVPVIILKAIFDRVVVFSTVWTFFLLIVLSITF